MHEEPQTKKEYIFPHIPKSFNKKIMWTGGGFYIILGAIIFMPLITGYDIGGSAIFLLLFVPFVLFFGILFYFHRKVARKHQEKITLFDEGFHSKQFGKIVYKEIKSLRFYNIPRGPSIFDIRLKDGEKLLFSLSSVDWNYTKPFMGFVKAIAEAASQYDQVKIYGVHVNDKQKK